MLNCEISSPGVPSGVRPGMPRIEALAFFLAFFFAFLVLGFFGLACGAGLGLGFGRGWVVVVVVVVDSVVVLVVDSVVVELEPVLEVSPKAGAAAIEQAITAAAKAVAMACRSGRLRFI